MYYVNNYKLKFFEKLILCFPSQHAILEAYISSCFLHFKITISNSQEEIDHIYKKVNLFKEKCPHAGQHKINFSKNFKL